MIKKIWSLFFAVGLSLMTINAAAKPSEEAIYTQDKTSIMVTADHPTFTFRLRSNPTTGYSWYLRDYDGKLIQPVRHSFEHPDKKLIGAPGFELWTFKATSAAFFVPQQTIIRMVYVRPWQEDTNATQVIFRVSTRKN